jgi:hypothetical protein
MRSRIAIALLALLAVGGLVVALTRSSSVPAKSSPLVSSAHVSPAATRDVLSDPIDPKYLTEVPFGATSFWIQPWRAYLDTWPASRLREALGINFNVPASEAVAVARLLHDSAFKLARIEINWDSLSYANPSRFIDEASVRTRLEALHEYGLRPLILLDANSDAPAPAKRMTLETVASAPAGAGTVTLSAASAAEVVPGRSGFDAVAFNPAAGAHRRRGARGGARRAAGSLHARGTAGSLHARGTAGSLHAGGAGGSFPVQSDESALTPEQRRERREQRRAARRAAASAGLTALVRQGDPAILITKISPQDVATLSRPLPVALAAGTYRGTTLLYAPFSAPKLADGAPSPAFAATLHGWLGYVATVSRLAQSIFGPGGYDLEIWNELTFGSQFLNASYYYASTGKSDLGAATKAITKALLDETVAYVRNPANGISPGVGITDGFASQTPFPSPTYAPAGLTAYSKHLYDGAKSFPSEYRASSGRVPRNALGERDTVGSHGTSGALTPLFVPHYQSLFPEYYLTATSTETVVRDLAPFTTYIYKAPHGRYVARANQRPPQVWMTEYNLSTHGASVMGPDGVTPEPVTLTTADKEHFEAKALLRSLVAMVNKGMTREYFYAAAPGNLSLIDKNFFTALEANPNTYPGEELGGETMNGFRNMLAQFQGPGPNGPPQQLKLLSITQEGNHAQFTGDGTAAHPNLYDREVLAVLPFQSSPTRFEIPIYVMTRDLLTLYEPNAPASDIHRFDLPNENFRITLANLPETTTPPTISAYDPLRNETTPTHLISQQGNTATIEIAATDYPRILTLNFTGGSRRRTAGRRAARVASRAPS